MAKKIAIVASAEAPIPKPEEDFERAKSYGGILVGDSYLLLRGRIPPRDIARCYKRVEDALPKEMKKREDMQIGCETRTQRAGIPL